MTDTAVDVPEETVQSSTAWRLVMFVLFFYMVQPFEVPGDPGLGWVIKAVLMTLLVAGFFLRTPYIANQRTLTLAVGAATILIALNVSNISNSALISAYLVFGGIVISDFAVSSNRDEFILLVTAYLGFNVFGFVLAQAWYTISGNLYDFHHLIIPFSAARLGFELGLARVTGFHIEPGTYANWTFLAVALRMMLTRRIANWFNSICMLSTVLSFSAWAGVAAALYFSAAILEQLTSRGLLTLAGLRFAFYFGIAALVIGVVVWAGASGSGQLTDTFSQFYLTRFSMGSGSYYTKVAAYGSFIAALPEVIFFGRPLTDSYCPLCTSTQDLGVWSQLIYYVGLLPFVAMTIAMFYKLIRSYGLAFALAMSPMFLTKTFFYDPLLWIILGALFISGQPETGDGSDARGEADMRPAEAS